MSKRNTYIRYIIFLTFILLTGCTKPSTIEVQNNLKQAILKNVYWGEVPVAYELLPDMTSGKVKIYEDAHYNLDFPEEFKISFYMELNGNKIHLQTKQTYLLGNEDNLIISISDSIEVSEIDK